MDKHFFDTVRPMFGKLTVHQVAALAKLCEYGRVNKVSRLHLSYVLATVFHETGKWMQPIREGAWRYGPGNYSDAQARRAVAKLFADGVISRNYALPDPETGQSYYGRGLVQCTHKHNYAVASTVVGKDCVANPDLLLEWDISAKCTFIGMRDGTFRKGKSLAMIKSTADFTAARDIINGDVAKNGKMIAEYAMTFNNALENYTWATKVDPVETIQEIPMPEQRPVQPPVGTSDGNPGVIAAVVLLAIALAGLLAWKKGWLDGVRYFRPASLTWWASVASIGVGGTQIACSVCDFGEVGRLLALLQGGVDASPASLVMLGLVGVGLNDKFERSK